MLVIQQDTREQARKHDHILKYFKESNIKVVRSKLYVGDYTRLDKQDVCIDTKKDLQEVYQNVILNNTRFKNECIRAKEAGIKLIVLVEDESIQDVSQVEKWHNRRLDDWIFLNEAHKKGKLLNRKISAKPPASSAQLQKAMQTMSDRYGVEWQFCKRENMGHKIVEILTREVD